MSTLTKVWVWFYDHIIKDPQAVTDLYEESVDDLNNALQCNNCFSIFIPEDAICPDCHKAGHFEMVWAPGIEEDEREPRPCDACGGEDTPPEPFWLSLYWLHDKVNGDCLSTDYLHDSCLKNRIATDKTKKDGYGVKAHVPCPNSCANERELLTRLGWPAVGECFREKAPESIQFEHLLAEIKHQRLFAENANT